MKISLGADHAGFELKNQIRAHLQSTGVPVDDKGTDTAASVDYPYTAASVDYPDYARKVAEDIAARRADLGILVCGTGIGMCMAANKVPGIRAANCDTEFEAQMAREHNDANILTIGARVVEPDVALKIVDKWLATTFAGGRHQTRVDKIMAIEPGKSEKQTSGRS